MYNIVFSLPIHEKLEVVVDQLVNIKWHNPECAIVIHISPVFCDTGMISYDSFLDIIRKLGDIFINPERVRTGGYDLIQAHLSNFNYAYNYLDFKYIAFIASNELFIKKGLFDSISKYDCILWRKEEQACPHWMHFKLAKRDPDLKLLMQKENLQQIYGSQVEGTVYSKELFKRIYDIIDKYFDYSDINLFYAREEVYFATLFWGINDRECKYKVLNDVFTWCPWSRQFTVNVLLSEAKRLRNSNNVSGYSVKRVDRDINDCVRSLIRRDCAYIDEENVLFDGSIILKKHTDVELYISQFLKEIKVHITLIRKIFKKVFGK